METQTANTAGNGATPKGAGYYAPLSAPRTPGQSIGSIVREIGGTTLTDINATPTEPNGMREAAPSDAHIGTTGMTRGYVAPTSVPAMDATPRRLWREASHGLARISIDPAVSDGRPMIRGTRIGVSQLMDELADLGAVDAVVREFDGVIEPADVQEALAFAARLAR